MSKKWVGNVLATFCFAAMGGVLIAANLTTAESEKGKCQPHEMHRVEDIVRIFMHRPNDYTFIYGKAGEEYKLTGMTASSYDMVTFVPDVPKDTPLWAITIGCEQGVFTRSVEIHIRQPIDVEGGGWNLGKNGSGMTIPVQ